MHLDLYDRDHSKFTPHVSVAFASKGGKDLLQSWLIETVRKQCRGKEAVISSFEVTLGPVQFAKRVHQVNLFADSMEDLKAKIDDAEEMAKKMRGQ